MDQNPYRRKSSPIRTTAGGSQFVQSVSYSELLSVKFLSSGTMKLTRTFTTCLILFSVLLAFSMIFHHHPSDPNRTMGFAEARVLDGRDFSDVTTTTDSNGSDKLLGGLLATGFDEDSCLSRYQSSLYRKPSPYKPSPYLVSKLRSYETLHKRCGPGTESYKKALKQLDQEHVDDSSNGECRYVVWVSFSGLGNRILSLASVFLYALLTDRVLLVDRGKDMDDLFCEPFPGMSWLLPLDFTMTDQFDGLNQESPRCYGYMLKNQAVNTEKALSHLYLHLVHDYGDQDKMFFCQGDQTFIKKVPWLIVKTDNYFVPSLWLIPGFDDELSKLFPEKETVFHHLGRYLFHPRNQVWGLVTRYYEAYLSNADEKIGIQVRVFDVGAGPFQHVMDQISACTRKEKLLPEVDTTTLEERSHQEVRGLKHKAVLVTSLSSGYSENLKSVYWEYPTSTGEIISVHQPSQEGYQQTEKKMHNGKALAEMYLLSLTDSLVTSAWSTFGYVAQGLGGLKPWILYKPENRTAPDPACVRAMSMEPCFHAPPFYDCKAKTGIDTGKLVPHVRHCEDMSWGLKLGLWAIGSFRAC